MKSVFAASAILLAALAGCAKTPPALTLDQTARIGIKDVAVSIPPDASIWWGAEERRYAAANDCALVNGNGCDYWEFVKSDDARAHVREALAAKLRDDLNRSVKPTLSGTEAARLEIAVMSLRVPSAAEKILTGGAHRLIFTARLVDIQSGDPIVTSDTMRVEAGYSPGGLIAVAFDAASRDPVGRLAEEASEEVCAWARGGDADCD